MLDQVIRKRILKVEWGDHGAFVYYRHDDTSLNIGDRIDLEDIKVEIRGDKHTIYTGGVWYVSDYMPIPGTSTVMYRLIRGCPDLCYYGDGETLSNEEIAERYNMPVFRMAQEKVYITFPRGTRRYRTIIKSAQKLYRFSLPIFEVTGDVRLVNIFYADYNGDNDIFATLLARQKKFPNIGSPKMFGTSNYELHSQLGDEQSTNDYFAPPGTVFWYAENRSLDKHTSTDKKYVIIRKLILDLGANPTKFTTYYSDYHMRDFMLEISGDEHNRFHYSEERGYQSR